MNKMQMNFSDYYIVFFDVLGSKAFFDGNEQTELEFVKNLKEMIERSIESVISINSSLALNQLANMQVEYKLFSDNISIYMKVSDSPLEIIRLLTFLETIASIQKDVLFSNKFLLRGGIVKGRLYANNSFFFGKGLIDAVVLEKFAKYPRICLDTSITDKALFLINNLADLKFLRKEGMFEWFRSLVLKNENENVAYLNYLPKIELNKVYPNLKIDDQRIIELLKNLSTSDYEIVQKLRLSCLEKVFDSDLKKHRDVLLENIGKYCNYDGVDKNDLKTVEHKAKIIQKYKWLVVYHNQLCSMHKKNDYLLTFNYTFDPVTLNDFMK